MENGTAPDELSYAIQRGEVEVVRSWLDNGGDVSAKCKSSNLAIPDPELLLIVAARCGKTSVMDLLLSRGADVDATEADGRTALYELLNYWATYGSLPALRLLLSNGADVNLAVDSISGAGTPLYLAAGGGDVDCVRMLVRAGADPEHRARDGERRSNGETAEEFARYLESLAGRYGEASPRWAASADFLRDVRLAGGWTRYFLRPHKSLLVLRALCHRGRATHDNRTPEVLVRLFGAPDGRRRKYTIRGRVDLPDPLFWRVLEFSLGPLYDYPWVRQRVRARAAAVAAAE